jgi:hypothetical protein
LHSRRSQFQTEQRSISSSGGDVMIGTLEKDRIADISPSSHQVEGPVGLLLSNQNLRLLCRHRTGTARIGLAQVVTAVPPPLILYYQYFPFIRSPACGGGP